MRTAGRAYGGAMTTNRTAIITGASRGLGLALARALADRGWSLVIGARGADELDHARAELGAVTAVAAIPGDIAAAGHRHALVEAAGEMGGLDLLVNNAGALGPSPLPAVADLTPADLEALLRTNAVAPLALIQEALPLLAARAGRILNVTSDAAVEAYEGWGGYGASKAALEQLSNVLAAEHPELRVYWVDPGDMNTRMQQDAYPGEDVSDRPPPEASVPGFLALLDGDFRSGRYSARALAAEETRA